MPTPFTEERLPVSISEGSKGGMGFSTDVFESETGFEQRNSKWAKSRAKYDIGFGIRSKADMEEVIEFFANMRGKATGFRYKDWIDYNVVGEDIGTAAGAPITFQIKKTYTTGSLTYVRDIIKIVADPAPIVKVAGVTKTETTDYTINYNTGIVSLSGTPTGIVTVWCEFDVPVRFDIDELMVTAETWLLESVESIPLVEIKPY